MIEEFIQCLRNPLYYENGLFKMTTELALIIADELEKLTKEGE